MEYNEFTSLFLPYNVQPPIFFWTNLKIYLKVVHNVAQNLYPNQFLVHMDMGQSPNVYDRRLVFTSKENYSDMPDGLIGVFFWQQV
jgi:hypothetical protein